MKVEIEETSNGFIVTYYQSKALTYRESVYVFKSTDDLIMLEDLAQRLLSRRVKIEEK